MRYILSRETSRYRKLCNKNGTSIIVAVVGFGAISSHRSLKSLMRKFAVCIQQ